MHKFIRMNFKFYPGQSFQGQKNLYKILRPLYVPQHFYSMTSIGPTKNLSVNNWALNAEE